MIKSTIAICTLLLLNAFSHQHSVDLKMSVDPIDAKNRSHIDIVAQKAFEFKNFSILLSPEIAFYFNKSVDFGLTLGHRWNLAYGAVGHYVFFDRSQLPKISVNQVGSGFDYITDKFDVRLNYYHPISPALQLKDRIVKPCKWIESEGIFKHKYVHIGAGPTFNIDAKVVGVQSKIIFPFDKFSLGLGASIDQNKHKQLFLITSFHLYKTSKYNHANSPSSHTKRPKIYSYKIKQEPSKVSAPKVKEEEEEIEGVEEQSDDQDSEQKDTSEEVIEDPKVVAPMDVPPPENDKGILKTISDFFFTSR